VTGFDQIWRKFTACSVRLETL